MAIKIYGMEWSKCVARVLLCLLEKDIIDYKLVSVDLRSGHLKQQPFVSLNPFGQIPAMEDGEITIFESRAINRYLARNYEAGTDLLQLRPNNLNSQAVLESWMEDEAHHPPMSIIIRETVIKPFFGDERVVEAKAEKLGKVLDVYEERLSRSESLGDDMYTMADLNHIPYVVYLMKSDKVSLVISRPRVNAWRGKIDQGHPRDEIESLDLLRICLYQKSTKTSHFV